MTRRLRNFWAWLGNTNADESLEGLAPEEFWTISSHTTYPLAAWFIAGTFTVAMAMTAVDTGIAVLALANLAMLIWLLAFGRDKSDLSWLKKRGRPSARADEFQQLIKLHDFVTRCQARRRDRTEV